jgi:hypothetical protein
MLIVGPSLIILLFIVAFVLWIKFVSELDDKTIKVIREEQLYNREKDVKKDQRKPVKREEKTEKEKEEEELPGLFNY